MIDYGIKVKLYKCIYIYINDMSLFHIWIKITTVLAPNVQPICDDCLLRDVRPDNVYSLN